MDGVAQPVQSNSEGVLLLQINSVPYYTTHRSKWSVCTTQDQQVDTQRHILKGEGPKDWFIRAFITPLLNTHISNHLQHHKFEYLSSHILRNRQRVTLLHISNNQTQHFKMGSVETISWLEKLETQRKSSPL